MYKKNFKIKKLLRKNFFSFSILIIIFAVFLQKTDLTGYISFIANKFEHLFSQKNIPKIINLDEVRRKPYWIFLYTNYDINDQYLILLNSNLDRNFDFSKFEILNNFQNKCFFLKRND